MSKVLLINGSPNEQGNTWTALNEVAGALERNGVETELLYLGKQPIADCIACYKCVKTGTCVFDDQVNQVIERLDEYDGLVLGSPVYFAGPSGRLCAFLDRLNRYFTYSNMCVVGSSYWNMVHGLKPGEVKEDLEGMQTMRVLGENMAWMLRSLESGRSSGVAAPAREKKAFTNFVR